jgi:hypothetical protein
MGVSPMEQQEYSFTIAFSSYLLRGLGDGRPQPAEHQYNVPKTIHALLSRTSNIAFGFPLLMLLEYYY